MPHTKSAKKRLRQNEKRRLHNRTIKKSVKTQIKKFLALVKEGPIDQLQNEYSQTAKKLDQAAAKRVIHANLAARKKSQLARLLHSRKTTPQPAPAGQ
jgi:small subunit ribosomal protein S20